LENDYSEQPETEDEEENTEVLHLLACGVEKKVVEELQKVVQRAGMKLVKTAPALCTYISLIRSQKEYLTQITNEYAILDLGNTSINLYMYKNDQHIATREIDTGLEHLDDIVADIYSVDKHIAHTYILNNYENCLEREECSGFYENISVEIMRAINFYKFSNPNSELSELWLCGGGAVNKGLIQTLDETLDVNLHSSHELLPDGKSIFGYNNFVQAIGVTLEI
jgi:type IV pilus assembly protein PilM